MGEEKLSGVTSVATEAVVVSADEVGLADGGGGLDLAQVIGAFRKSQPADARSDGSRADEGDLATGGGHGRDFLGEMVNPRGV